MIVVSSKFQFLYGRRGESNPLFVFVQELIKSENPPDLNCSDLCVFAHF